jgi:putative hydrolase of the HAD superfamily
MKDLLDSLEKLEPIPTDTKENFEADLSIKACIFDIYGTLLISSSGDVDLSDVSNDYLLRAFNESGIKILSEACADGFCERALLLFEETIKKAHKEAQENGFPHPEVDITEIWSDVLNELVKQNEIELTPHFDLKHMTSLFEVLSNKVFPMPGMKEIISYLKEKQMPIGIISNAQFYTPIIMNYFLHGSVNDMESVESFDNQLCVFSYKEKRAKPDPSLFKKLLSRLSELNITPQEAVFVGNDMLKDVYTAHCNGFKTILFAGDKRSLRWRENSKEVNGLQPDYVVTKLAQIKEIIV